MFAGTPCTLYSIMSTFVLIMSTNNHPDALATTPFGKLRRELLALLYGDSERSLYLRELVRITGASPGAEHQREVGELTRVGLLIRTRRGRQVFYEANRSHPVFHDLRSLLKKTVGAVDVLRGALAASADQIDAAVLFGSMAKGTGTFSSDIDVLVVGIAAIRGADERPGPRREGVRGVRSTRSSTLVRSSTGE